MRLPRATPWPRAEGPYSDGSDPMSHPYLPDRPSALVIVDDRWSAVSVPLDWGHLVVAALGDECGPAFSDAGLRHVVYFLPPEGGADWPDATGAGIFRHPPGTEMLVPGPEGCASMGWLRFPLDGRTFTDPTALRTAVEGIVGPLETAAAFGPVVVCHVCGDATHNARLVGLGEQLTGPGWARYLCGPCDEICDGAKGYPSE